MNNVAQNGEKSIIGAIKIDQKEVQDHLNTLVREAVEETLNNLLNAEADAICNASRYERSPDRLDTRAGTYKRKLLTRVGEVELQVPRLRTLPFETQIIERYRRKESSVEEAMVEMYLARFGAWKASRMRCGVRRSVRGQSAGKSGKFTIRSSNGGCVRSRGNIRMFSSMACT